MQTSKAAYGFGILPKDIDAAQKELAKTDDLPDPSKALTPVVFSFRSTSFKAGREVSTFSAQVRSVKQPIHKYYISLSCKLEKNDQGTFYVWVVDRSKPKAVVKTHLPLVEEWASIVNGSMINLSLHEEAEANQAEVPQPGLEKEVTQEAKAEVC